MTPIASGGLGLSADHYAALVATMFFFSMVWQFKFYSAVGPAQRSLSHLSMCVPDALTLRKIPRPDEPSLRFRLGLILYVPVRLCPSHARLSAHC